MPLFSKIILYPSSIVEATRHLLDFTASTNIFLISSVLIRLDSSLMNVLRASFSIDSCSSNSARVAELVRNSNPTNLIKQFKISDSLISSSKKVEISTFNFLD